jgi:hypothetical protein
LLGNIDLGELKDSISSVAADDNVILPGMTYRAILNTPSSSVITTNMMSNINPRWMILGYFDSAE